ncbi:MAG: polyprenyl synthetase family protein [Hyphomicrobium sp.]|nr:polyprenyl synthetase family protein [Hyphomicrobium sp.]
MKQSLGTPPMPLAQSLAHAAAVVEARLAEILNEVGAPERLSAAMGHGVLGGGKRFRPLLVIESARLFGVPEPRAVEVAAALELVHCYSLAHDDLPSMDNDALRRGRPTVWKAFDEWTAILAGDGLLTLAFEVLSRPDVHPAADVRVTIIRELAVAAGRAGMVGGQALDLEADKLGRPAQPTADHVRRLQSMKTGALIVFACEAGALLGEASLAERGALKRFGTALGFAFQIADDLLDAEGDAAVVGKAVAKDAKANKATLVSLMGRDAARASLADAEAEAIEALGLFGVRGATLAEAARFVVGRRS